MLSYTIVGSKDQNHLSYKANADMFTGIDPKYQGKGLGSMLLETCIAMADAEELPIFLQSMPAPYSLYARHGFTVLDHVDIDLSEWGRKLCGYGIHRSYAMMREP
jgi:GNAT superfamily N-acetyltransferase